MVYVQTVKKLLCSYNYALQIHKDILFLGTQIHGEIHKTRMLG